jgi:hypothetical protein
MEALRPVGMILSLASIVCWIIVLIKLFQTEGALKGILGFICGLYTFIWGWMNSSRVNIKTIMLIWTAVLLGAIIINSMTGGFSYSMGTPTTP